MGESYQVVVIGGGAAGLVAAGRAAELGARVLLLEKMEQVGNKILVTGKERCNVTNSAPLEEFITYFGPQGVFLRNAFHRFFRDELLDLLKRNGVKTQEERGGRIFPASGKAADVRDALLYYASRSGAVIRSRVAVEALLTRNGRIDKVRLTSGETISTRTVVLATGGASWPATGSTGEGYRMAEAIGHTLVPLRPALVPLTVAERGRARELQGVSLRRVSCKLMAAPEGQAEFEIPAPYPLPPVGEILFTHFGLSGPLVLTLSLAAVDAVKAYKKVYLSIDLKPGMTSDEIRARLQSEFEQYPKRHLHMLLAGWGPRKLGEVLATACGVGLERLVHSIRAEERERLVMLFKDFRWQVTGSLSLAAGMVTAGGVALSEVDPRTMASRKVEGLYLAGEVLDLAADTGGFNLQAAFTTGYLAGESAAQAS